MVFTFISIINNFKITFNVAQLYVHRSRHRFKPNKIKCTVTYTHTKVKTNSKKIHQKCEQFLLTLSTITEQLYIVLIPFTMKYEITVKFLDASF